MSNTKVAKLAQKFCEDANEISLVLDGTFIRQFLLGKDEKRFDKEKIFTTSDLNIETCEIHRSIVCANGDVLFSLDIDFHNDKLEDGLEKAINVARKVEAIFPNQFLWAFSGRNIHGHAYIRYNKENEAHIIRYGRVFDFCKAIVFYLRETHHINAGDTAPFHYKGLIKSIGSYHRKTGLHKIPITLDLSVKEIIERSAKLECEDWTIPDLDIHLMRNTIPIYTSLFNKVTIEHSDEDKVPIAFEKYPSCIAKLMAHPNKGNKLRFDLLRYFFFLHKKSDVLEIMKKILTQPEFAHMMREKQYEHVYTHGYPPPTARYLKETYGYECDRPNPTLLDWDKQE